MGVLQPNSSSRKQLEKIDNLFGGINIVDENNKLRDGEFRNLSNITLYEEGSLKKRTGYKEIFNFRTDPKFKVLFEKISTTHNVLSNFPVDWDQERDNTPQMLEVVNYIKQFAILGYERAKVSLMFSANLTKKLLNPKQFITEDISDDEEILNSYWDPEIFSVEPNNDVTLTTQLDKEFFEHNFFEIEIDNFDVNRDDYNFVTTITSSVAGEKKLTIKIGDWYNETVDLSDDIKSITEVYWGLEVFGAKESKPETLKFLKFEEVFSDVDNTFKKEAKGYLVAYTYDEKLWFTYFDIEKEEYIPIEWWLINEENPELNDYKFKDVLDDSGEVRYKEIATILKNSDWYIKPNSVNNEDGTTQYPYVGVDIKSYRNKIYIATGYGFLEVSYEDIQNGNLYEMIPKKPEVSEYQTDYANLLALNLKSENILTTDVKTKFQSIWNWDWVSWPKSANLSGLITQYPANSKYPTIIRASINFEDEQMVSKWQYQWRWVAPQELLTTDTNPDESMPIIEDFKTNNWELPWKPIVREETINTYVVKNPEEKKVNQIMVDETKDTHIGYYSGQSKPIENFYVGGSEGAGSEGSEGSALKWKVDSIYQAITELNKATSLDFTGNLLIGVRQTLDTNLIGNIRLPLFETSNWRVKFFKGSGESAQALPGDETQGFKDDDKPDLVAGGWWKLQVQDHNWNDSGWHYLPSNGAQYNYGHRLFPFKIINSDKLLEMLKKQDLGETSTGYIEILFTLKSRAEGGVEGTSLGNTTVHLQFNPNQSQWNSNGLMLSFGYQKISVSDSNSLGLTPINNLEQTLNLEYLQNVKECTQIEFVREQMFCWGSRSSPHIVWYSRPFSPNYISVIDTIALNRTSNETIKAIEPFGQQFIIFTDKTIYILNFSESGMSIKIGNPNFGIEHRESVNGIGNSIIFLNESGVYQIRSSGMDINNTIKVREIDRKIRGSFDLQDVVWATSTTLGEVYYLLVGTGNGKYEIYTYYALRDVWTKYITNHNFNFTEMLTIKGRIYTLTNDGVLNQWYTQVDERNLIYRQETFEDANEFLLKVMQLYSDGYDYTQTKFESSAGVKPEVTLKNFQDASPQSFVHIIMTDESEFTHYKVGDSAWLVNDVRVTDEQMFEAFQAVDQDSISYIGLIYVNYIPDYKLYNIEAEMLSKEFSGIGENVHNIKKFKEIQLKHTKSVFATQSEITVTADGVDVVYPYRWETGVNDKNEFTAVMKRSANLNQNMGSWVNESMYATDSLSTPKNSPYRTLVKDNTEFNNRIKKGAKTYTMQFKLVNREALPFGLKSFLLIYKYRKAK